MDTYSEYDFAGDDPYLLPHSTCLANLLDLTDTAALNHAEDQFTKIRLAGLQREPVAPTFDLIHLQHIHARLFGDIYPFAGALRTVEISKGQMFFLPYRLMEAEAQRCFAALHSQRLLEGLDVTGFGSEAGFFLGWINKIHPFREGNGRAQRVLLDQLAHRNGFAIEWAAMSKSAMAQACRAARSSQPDFTAIRRLIAINTVIAVPGDR